MDQLSIGYTYVDIRMDDDGRMKVRAICQGYESVPTLVFADGSTLIEPTEDALFAHLLALGYSLDPLTPLQRALIYMANPTIAAFGMGVLIVGAVLQSSTVIGAGVFLTAVPLLAVVIPELLR